MCLRAVNAYAYSLKGVQPPVRVRSKYFRFSAEARRLWIDGHSITEIAGRLHLDRITATKALRYAIPNFDAKAQRRQSPQFLTLQSQVVPLAQQRLTFKEIGAKLGVSVFTVRRAWNAARSAPSTPQPDGPPTMKPDPR